MTFQLLHCVDVAVRAGSNRGGDKGIITVHFAVVSLSGLSLCTLCLGVAQLLLTCFLVPK
jgi:hypothetical protein